MALYRIIELDYDMNGAPDYYPHNLDVDGVRVMSDAPYNDVLRYVQRHLKPSDEVIEQYHTGTEVKYDGKRFLTIIPHIWRFQ